jgi:neuron navigator 2
VRGLAARFLRQRVLALETQTRAYDAEMAAVVDFVAKFHAQLNRLIEAHSAPEATIGPKAFLACPVTAAAARDWFVALWNSTLRSQVVDAVRDGVQMYGRRAVDWHDPVDMAVDAWPWMDRDVAAGVLQRIAAVDVGLADEISANSAASAVPEAKNPLNSLLMQLQEATASNCANTD